jgi:hypothetical protein
MRSPDFPILKAALIPGLQIMNIAAVAPFVARLDKKRGESM